MLLVPLIDSSAHSVVVLKEHKPFIIKIYETWCSSSFFPQITSVDGFLFIVASILKQDSASAKFIIPW